MESNIPGHHGQGQCSTPQQWPSRNVDEVQPTPRSINAVGAGPATTGAYGHAWPAPSLPYNPGQGHSQYSFASAAGNNQDFQQHRENPHPSQAYGAYHGSGQHQNYQQIHNPQVNFAGPVRQQSGSSSFQCPDMFRYLFDKMDRFEQLLAEVHRATVRSYQTPYLNSSSGFQQPPHVPQYRPAFENTMQPQEDPRLRNSTLGNDNQYLHSQTHVQQQQTWRSGMNHAGLGTGMNIMSPAMCPRAKPELSHFSGQVENRHFDLQPQAQQQEQTCGGSGSIQSASGSGMEVVNLKSRTSTSGRSNIAENVLPPTPSDMTTDALSRASEDTGRKHFGSTTEEAEVPLNSAANGDGDLSFCASDQPGLPEVSQEDIDSAIPEETIKEEENYNPLAADEQSHSEPVFVKATQNKIEGITGKKVDDVPAKAYEGASPPAAMKKRRRSGRSTNTASASTIPTRKSPRFKKGANPKDRQHSRERDLSPDIVSQTLKRRRIGQFSEYCDVETRTFNTMDATIDITDNFSVTSILIFGDNDDGDGMNNSTSEKVLDLPNDIIPHRINEVGLVKKTGDGPGNTEQPLLTSTFIGTREPVPLTSSSCVIGPDSVTVGDEHPTTSSNSNAAEPSQGKVRFISPESIDGPVPFKCCVEPCEKAFETRKALRKHVFNHRFDSFFKCETKNCNFKCSTKKELSAHKRKHGRELFRCDVCPRVFFSASALKNHYGRHKREGASAINKTSHKPTVNASMSSSAVVPMPSAEENKDTEVNILTSSETDTVQSA